MPDDFLSDRKSALEDSFFRRRDAELLEQMKKQMSSASQRDALAAASGISDETMLDRLIGLKLNAETVAALSLVPLVQVAWSDEKLEAAEKDAILKAATESGLGKDSAAYKSLLGWLDAAPEPELFTAWTDYVQELSKTMSAEDCAALRDGLIARAEQVATAAGGFLGLGSKVTESEQTVIDQLKSAFQTA